MTDEAKKRFDRIIGPLASDPAVAGMARFVQHGRVTTLEHCLRVARLSWAIDQKLRLHSDPTALIRSALLHDFYLYDWHDKAAHPRWHGFHHARAAAMNARAHFRVTTREMDVIRSHMWPLNLTCPPRSREGWIVCLADKCCSLKETLFIR